MINKILTTIASALGELLELIIKLFLDSINLSLEQIVTTFPFLAVGFKIFQGIALGFVIVIAVWSAVKRATSGITGSMPKKDIASHVLRIVLAVALIFFGNIIFEQLLRLIKIPFDFFTGNFEDVIVLSNVEWESLNWTSNDTISIALGQTTILLATIVLVVLIGWNLIKLLLEVFERYLMIGVLVYASPLAFMTAASEETEGFCIKYVKSFIGQCAVMIISVWSINIVLSGFSFIGHENVFFRLIATYAICKIAQRLDTYMQGWGVGTLTTGQNLLDAGLAAAGAIGLGTRRREKSSPESTGSDTPKVGGVIGGLSGAIRGAKNTFVQGGSAKDIGKAAKTSFMKGAGLGGIQRNAEKRKNGEKVTIKDRAVAAGLIAGSGPAANKAEQVGEQRREALEKKSLNTGKGVVEGSEAIGAFAAESYAELSNPENKELNDAATAAIGKDPAAAQSLLNSDADFTGNDQLGNAAIKSAYDLPPELSNGDFSNISKTSVEGGGYKATATYTAKDGAEKEVTMYSREAFNKLPIDQQIEHEGESIRTGRTKGGMSHETAYFKISDTKQPKAERLHTPKLEQTSDQKLFGEMTGQNTPK